MLENLRKYKIVLASKSPRRKELLAEVLAGCQDFDVRTMSGIDESFPADLSHEETALYIADSKRRAYAPTLADDELCITADTIVCIDGEVLGKPTDEVDAMDMIRQLSGRTHEVVTAVTLSTTERHEAFAVTTKVTFAELDDEQIRYYVELFEPLDKAGAYGIQEWIGTVGITSIEGSYQNVVGLPTQELYAHLAQW